MNDHQPRDLCKTITVLIPRDTLEGPYYRLLACGVDYGKGPWPAMSFFEDASGIYGGWIYVLSGSIRYAIDGHRHKVEAGQALVNHRPEPGHLLRPVLDQPLHVLWINVGGEPAMTMFDYLRRKYGQIQDIPMKSEPIRLAKKLIRLANAESQRPPHFWSMKIFEWLSAWWRCADEFHRPIDRQILVTRPSRVLSEIPKTVKEFAAELGYSRAYLTRKLSKRWDDTPARVLRRLRLEEAERLLRTTTMGLQEVAAKCGYSSTISFSKAFRLKYKQPPGAYRHTHR